ncbi:hypothetical protein [Sandaracinus amylolyticus]|uniref:hypothetical protein n=1 Tax=Sandaracinus amylolyticus TaxID=927083 RepID=UPI00069DC712|nr:hypothetical protein [Sandaracinus amylolyticus]
MHADVVIAPRFNGPPDSGNGGYSCGCVARAIAGSSRVRLHKPPPLDRAMHVEDDAGTHGVRLLDGETLVASGVPASVDVEVPAIPTLERAREASTRYVARDPRDHVFPTCFVCGPARAEGDGLRIFAGALGDGVVAAPFEPSDDLLAGATLRSEIVWAALDCPGYFAIVGTTMQPMLLGELAVDVRAPVGRGPHVIVGWSLGGEGRKARCGTALATPSGQVLAVGVATWIRIA